MNDGKIFCTVKETCDRTGLSQFYIRRGCAAGTIPHVKSGSKILVNVPLLIEWLNAESAGANAQH